jgi:hypothetical protein
MSEKPLALQERLPLSGVGWFVCWLFTGWVIQFVSQQSQIDMGQTVLQHSQLQTQSLETTKQIISVQPVGPGLGLQM